MHWTEGLAFVAYIILAGFCAFAGIALAAKLRNEIRWRKLRTAREAYHVKYVKQKQMEIETELRK